MNKILLNATVLLLVVFGFSSCMRPYSAGLTTSHHHQSNHPDYVTMHHHYKVKDNNLPSKSFSVKDDLNKPKIILKLVPETSLIPAIKTVDLQLGLLPAVSDQKHEQNMGLIRDTELKIDISKPSLKPMVKPTSAFAHKLSDNRILCAIIAIFIPPLGVALYENGITMNFWIDLILTLLFFIPGLIYALLVILG